MGWMFGELSVRLRVLYQVYGPGQERRQNLIKPSRKTQQWGWKKGMFNFFLSFDEHRHVILDVFLKNVYSCQLILWLVKRITVIRNSKWFCGSLWPEECLENEVSGSTWQSKWCKWTPRTLTSVCIFSILFPVHFVRCWQGEFVQQSRTLFVGDHFFNSRDLYAWFRGDNVKRTELDANRT